jgi:hypothetical protein
VRGIFNKEFFIKELSKYGILYYDNKGIFRGQYKIQKEIENCLKENKLDKNEKYYLNTLYKLL